MSIINTVPKDAPASTPQSNQPSARDRAIAKFNTQEHPVANPSNISPEEMSAISPKSEGQNYKDETPAGEEKAPPVKEETKTKDEPLSAQYAQLARKERALRAKAQEIKAQESQAKAQAAEAAELRAKLAKYEASEKRLQEDPLSALLERGLTYDQLTQKALNAPSAEELASKLAYDKLQAEIQSIKEAQESSKKLFEDQQTQQYNQAVNQIRQQTRQLVDSDPNFETIKETGSTEDVVDLIKTTFEKDGVLMTVEEAAAAVEEYLLEEAIKLTKLKKIQQKLRSAEPKSVEQKTLPSEQKQQSKTLTNSLTTSRPLTTRERAILAFQGKLGKN